VLAVKKKLFYETPTRLNVKRFNNHRENTMPKSVLWLIAILGLAAIALINITNKKEAPADTAAAQDSAAPAADAAAPAGDAAAPKDAAAPAEAPKDGAAPAADAAAPAGDATAPKDAAAPAEAPKQ
jgi:cytoskeletal protein RodZ